MEFLREFLAAVGGAVGVVLIIFVFFKGIVQKWIDTTIDKAAEKSLAKYSNTLERKTKAYETLLDKELSYYEYLSDKISDLIVGTTNCSVYLGVDGNTVTYAGATKACDEVSILQKVEFELSRRNAAMCCYFENDIFTAVITLINDCALINESFIEGIKQITETNNLSKETCQEIQRLTNAMITSSAKINSLIKKRLTTLSQE